MKLAGVLKPSSTLSKAFLGVVLATLASLLFCRDMLHDLDRWGIHDWGIFFFHNISVYRSIVEFGEAPLWNPWCLGGMPLMANPQTLVPDPWFGLDLLVGPLVAIRLKVVAHYALGLLGGYWCGRQFRLSRLASIYLAGTFIFSTWLALHLQVGHFSFLCGVYIPWVVGFLQRSRSDVSQALYGSLILALMAFQGGVFMVIFTAFITGPVALGWSIQERSRRPLVGLCLLWGCFAGVSAVKLLPAFELVRAAPRDQARDPEGKLNSVVGGKMWSEYRKLLLDVPNSTTLAGPEVSPAKTPRKKSKWDMVAALVKIFLGREQRGLEHYYAFQGFEWSEYGAYLGPLALLLLIAAPFVLRSGWPWMVAGGFCFLTGVGNVAPFAPWTLLHRLPVLSNMRSAGRFLIPCAFAGSMLAAMVLDELLSRARNRAEGPRWVGPLAALLVAFALVDSFLVGRQSLQGAFPYPPPHVPARLASIITVKGWNDGGQTAAMLAIYSDLAADEALPVPIRVAAREDREYRGEFSFVDEANPALDGGGRVELLGWSPNTVRVRVASRRLGQVVLNRNWARGWTADAPYQATSYQGLIAARLGPGTHEVRFAYRPVMVRIGLALSLVTGLGIVAGLVWSGRRGTPSLDRLDDPIRDTGTP